MTSSTLEAVAKLNKICFGKEDEFNKPGALETCEVFTIFLEDTLVAYALVTPGKVAKLERYGTAPQSRGKGEGRKILNAVGQKFPVVFTYVSGLNIHSIKTLSSAGYLPLGSTGEWITLWYVNPLVHELWDRHKKNGT
jgi:hypothetical protein